MIEFVIGAIVLLVGACFCTSTVLRNIILCFAILLLLIGCCIKTQIENYDCSGVDCSPNDVVNIPLDDSGTPAIFSGKFIYTEFARFCDSNHDYSDDLGFIFAMIKDPLVTLLQDCITSVKFQPLSDLDDVTLVFNKNTDIKLTCSSLKLDSNYYCESGVYKNNESTCIDLCLSLSLQAKNLTLDLQVQDISTNIFDVTLEGTTTCRVGIELTSDNSVIVKYLELNDPNYNKMNVFSNVNGDITLIKGVFQYMDGIILFLNKTLVDVLDQNNILPYTIPEEDLPSNIVKIMNDILTINLNPLPDNYEGLNIPQIPVDVTIGYIDFQSIFITDVFYYLQFIIKNSKSITFFPNICSDSPSSCDGCDSIVYKDYDFSTCCQGSSLYNIDFSCQKSSPLTFKFSDVDLNATIDHICSINLFKLIPALFNQCKLEKVALKPCSTTSSTFCTDSSGHTCGDLGTYPWGCLLCTYSDDSESVITVCDIDMSSFIDDAKFELLSVTPAFKGNTLEVDQNKLNYVFSIVSGEGTINTNVSMKGKTVAEFLNYYSSDNPYHSSNWYNDVLQVNFENLRLKVNGVQFVPTESDPSQYIIQTDSFDLTYDDFNIVNIANLQDVSNFCDSLSQTSIITRMYCGFFAFFGNAITTALTKYAPQIIAILILGFLLLVFIVAFLAPFAFPVIFAGAFFLLEAVIFMYMLTVLVLAFVNGGPWNVDDFYSLGTKLIGTIFPWGNIVTTIFNTLNDKLKDNANTLLKKLILPVTPKNTFLTLFSKGTDYNCSCKNICARNWDNILSGAGGWKNASCGQTVQLDISGSSVTKANYYDCDVYPPPSTDTQLNGCLCIEDVCIDDTSDSCFQPNQNVSCNSPLGYYILQNSENLSCDVFCQQALGTLPTSSDSSQSETVRPPNTLSSYCLNAKKDDGTEIPCYTTPDSGENLTCFCSRNNDLYVPYSSTDYNIYGNIKLPVLATTVGVYLINLVDNMYLVCYQTDSSTFIVKGIPIQTGIPTTTTNFDILQALNQTPLSRNIYGEKSIWIFEKFTESNNVLYYIRSKFNGLYLYDPNGPLSFEAASNPDISTQATFENLTVKEKDDNNNNMRFVWKIIQNSTRNISIVNVFSNRCIVGINKDKLEEMFNIMSTPSPLDQSLATAYDCFNKYSNMNYWGIMNAAVFPPSKFDRNQTQQVYNICNVANWSTMSIFTNVQFLPPTTNILTINGQNYEYPKGPIFLPSFYPPSNSTSESQWLVQKISNGYYTIQNVSFGNIIYYLYENTDTSNCPMYGPEGSQICLNVTLKTVTDSTIPDGAKWRIPNIKKKGKENILYNVIQASSGKYLAQSEYSPLGDKDLSTQTINNLSKAVSLFYTTEAAGDPESDDFIINKHTIAWSFFPTDPQTVPTNFYRENIMCPPTSSDPSSPTPQPSSPTPQPSSNLCSTFTTSQLYGPMENPPDLSRGNLNILSNQTDNGACIVDFPNMLKIYTPPNYNETETWEQKVDDLQSQNLIPDFVPLRSPCNSYGNLSNYSLIGNASTGFNIQKSNDLKCMVYDPDAPNVKLKYEECGEPEWQVFPYNVSTSTAPFHYVTDFLEDGKHYYLLNAILRQLIYLKNNTLGFTKSTIGISTFPNETSDNGFSQIMYEKDDSDNTNHISFVNVDGNKYFGCTLSNVIDQINGGTLKQGSMIDISLFPEKSMDTAFNFILIKNTSHFQDYSNCYSYLIRSENTLPDKNGQYWAVYMAYKGKCEDPDCQVTTYEPAFYVAQCDNEPFNYLYNDIFLNELLQSADGNFLYWTFNNVNSISNAGNDSLLYTIKSTKDNSMCIEKATQEFAGTNIYYYDVKSCDDNENNINQRFSFQDANYTPADYPYINFQDVPST